jgi:hypothetical protein
VSSTCLDCRLLVPLRDSVPAHVITPLTEQSIFCASFTTLLTDVTTFFSSTPTQTTTTLPTTTHPHTPTARRQHKTTSLRVASSLLLQIPYINILPVSTCDDRWQTCLNCSLGASLCHRLPNYAELTRDNSGLAWHTNDETLRSKFEEFGQVQEAVRARHLSSRDRC